MKLTNISGFNDIHEYVHHKIKCYSAEDKSFNTLFKYMFSERDNVMAEISDGYRIKRMTYGEVHDRILTIAPTVSDALRNVQHGDIVGLYMNNSIEWIELFWATLAAGYKVLLMNTRLSDEILERVILDHEVRAVISDGKSFSVSTFYAHDLTIPSETAAKDACFGDEVIFMSSGTSEKIKLCAYTGESFYYQICESISIIDKCPQMKEHYDGELKQLALLPFCHVFGFIAVYIWFGFFARTFVFLKDMNPATILNTVKKHKVTHIFAVPLVWDTIYKEAMRTIRGRGYATHKRFIKALKISNGYGRLGKLFSRLALSEVRENIFGDSIKFLISGGSHIEKEVLCFFNGIGYHMANGYGMTEIGITSVDVSLKQSVLNLGSIGSPFGNTEYSVSESGELLVRGKAMPSRIIIGTDECLTRSHEWFHTHDLAKEKDGRYYLLGRQDDMIVCENGENINPVLVERRLKTDGVDEVCLVNDDKGQPLLIVSAPGCFSVEKLTAISNSINNAIARERLDGEIKHIVITTDRLLADNEFKISRRLVAERYCSGKLHILEPGKLGDQGDKLLSELERRVIACMATALEKPACEIGTTDDFFTVLGGTSLDYCTLINLIRSNFDTDLPIDGDDRPITVRDICNYISRK